MKSCYYEHMIQRPTVKHYLLYVCCIGCGVFLFLTSTLAPQQNTLHTQTSEAALFTKKIEKSYTSYILKTDYPITEINKLVGEENAHNVFAINRIDTAHVRKGRTLVIPTTFDDTSDFFMPETIKSASKIPKIIFVSQEMQSFGAYEYGKLIRSGPVSSGKKLTPTPSKLYFTNWKGRRIVSTVKDEWILNWNFNIDNLKGISLHQFALPGYPASHSCVRLYEADAQWIYNWASMWKLDDKERTVITQGTPVIIFGYYKFTKIAPWKELTTNPDATYISSSTINYYIKKYSEQLYYDN